MIRNWKPTGVQALFAFGLGVFLLFAANLIAVAFWNWNGGVGFLDFEGGQGSFDASIAAGFPDEGTAERVSAVVAHYSESAKSFHSIFTGVYDTVLPLTSFAMFVVPTLWAIRPLGKRLKTALTVGGLTFGLIYVLGEYSENITQLILLNSSSTALAGFLAVPTAVKEGGTAVSMLILLVSLAIGLTARVVNRRKNEVPA